MAAVNDLLNRNFERLDDEQIVQLTTQAQNGDVKARNRIVEAFIPMVRRIAQRYFTNRNVEEGDLVSYGVMGLMQAIETFNPNAGASFKTHSYRRIDGEIKDNFRRGEGLLVRTSRMGKGKVKLWESTREKLLVELGGEPQIEQIEEATGILLGDYLNAKFHSSREIIYADTPTNGGGHSNNGYKNMWEVLGLKFKHAGFDIIDNKDLLYRLMERYGLTQREKETIELVYGLREPTDEEWQRIVCGRLNAPKRRSKSAPEYRSFLTCLDTGYVLNISESRVYFLERRAMGKMKLALKRTESPNRALSYPSDGLYERGYVEPEVNNQYHSPAPEKRRSHGSCS